MSEALYCGFRINQDEFAISVNDVQEVIRPQNLTEVPLSNNQIKGLINLRGQIVTCLDLRVILGFSPSTEQHMNIIVNWHEQAFSFVVDEVTDVINVEKQFIDENLGHLSGEIKKYAKAIYKKDKGLVVLIDIDKVLSLISKEGASSIENTL